MVRPGATGRSQRTERHPVLKKALRHRLLQSANRQSTGNALRRPDRAVSDLPRVEVDRVHLTFGNLGVSE